MLVRKLDKENISQPAAEQQTETGKHVTDMRSRHDLDLHFLEMTVRLPMIVTMAGLRL